MFDEGPHRDERRADEPDPETTRMPRRPRRRAATERAAEALLSMPASATFRILG